MADDGDRMARAGNYVLGLMDDRERERAEHDLEIDPSFRDAVVEVAQRMHVFDHPPSTETSPDGLWKQIKEHIAEMPQMRKAAAKAETRDEAPVTFGRRRSDASRDPIVPLMTTAPTGLYSVPGWRALIMAAGLVAAFALGYVAGVSSIATPPTSSSEP